MRLEKEQEEEERFSLLPCQPSQDPLCSRGRFEFVIPQTRAFGNVRSSQLAFVVFVEPAPGYVLPRHAVVYKRCCMVPGFAEKFRQEDRVWLLRIYLPRKEQ